MAEKSVFEVLAKVQRELSVPKDQFNSFGKYKFRNLETINAAAKPVCEKYGAGYFLSDEVIPVDLVSVDKLEKDFDRTSGVLIKETHTQSTSPRFYVKATATFFADGCSETVSSTAYAREQEEKKGMDEAQITGLASSYARKYALCGLLAIDGNDDVDALDNRTPSKTNKPATKKTAAKKPEQTKDPQMVMAELVDQFARAKSKTPQDVCAALNNTKTLQGLGVTAATTSYTAEQQLAAIAILNQWLGN